MKGSFYVTEVPKFVMSGTEESDGWSRMAAESAVAEAKRSSQAPPNHRLPRKTLWKQEAGPIGMQTVPVLLVMKGDSRNHPRGAEGGKVAGEQDDQSEDRNDGHVTSERRELSGMVTLELSKEKRAEAIASIRKYFEEEIREPMGDLRAGLMLDFFLEEVGPAIYNKAIADAQARMTARVADLEGELYVDEFQYWVRQGKKKKGRA